jgi:multidrug efflux pump subunit AcrB
MADNNVGGLSGLAIKRPVFISMVMVLLVVLGIFSFNRLPIDQFPNVDIPVAVVQTVYPGASPETVEREVTRRMEEAFNPVEGVDRITSVSLEGVSVVTVEFDLGRDIDQATADIRTKIEGIRRNLPTDIESIADRPEIRSGRRAHHLARPRVHDDVDSAAHRLCRRRHPARSRIRFGRW